MGGDNVLRKFLKLIILFDIDYDECIGIYYDLRLKKEARKYLLRIWITDEWVNFCYVCGGPIGEIDKVKKSFYKIDPWHRHSDCYSRFLTKEEVIDYLLEIGLSKEKLELIDWDAIENT